MSTAETSTLNAFPGTPDNPNLNPEEPSINASSAPQDAPAGMLVNHKGKLAVGAAAMLGLAIFFKWRDHKLAKDDPEEYARLRRLKAAIGSGKPKQK